MLPIKRNLFYRLRAGHLHMRIRWDGNEFDFSTGHEISRDNWDGRRCRTGSRHGSNLRPAGVINRELQSIEDEVEQIFVDFERRGSVPSKVQLRALLFPERPQDDLFTQFNVFVIESAALKSWTDNTVKTVRQVIPILKAFRPSLSFADINLETLTAFSSWLQNNKVGGRFEPGNIKEAERDWHPSYTNSVVLKYCRIFKWFLRWAATKEFVKRDVVEAWKPSAKTISKPIVFLTPEELDLMERAELPPGSELDRARDILLFCAFSSLRYSDAQALRKTDVHGSYIDVVTIKTDTPVRIELNVHSARILSKWREFDGPKALPQLTLNRANKVIKDLGERLGLNEPVSVSQYYGAKRVDKVCPKHQLLSTHTGRRSFICNALALGIPPHVVMEWTGHSSLTAMQPYIAVASTTRSRAMELFNSLTAAGGVSPLSPKIASR